MDVRWKLVILHRFGGKTLRFSDLERAIPGISQKMLAQQLRQLEGDRIVTRMCTLKSPPKVEYRLTEWRPARATAADDTRESRSVLRGNDALNLGLSRGDRHFRC